MDISEKAFSLFDRRQKIIMKRFFNQ